MKDNRQPRQRRDSGANSRRERPKRHPQRFFPEWLQYVVCGALGELSGIAALRRHQRRAHQCPASLQPQCRLCPVSAPPRPLAQHATLATSPLTQQSQYHCNTIKLSAVTRIHTRMGRGGRKGTVDGTGIGT
eukprot:scaffold131040_cov37-Tisochrysis_lutea.AAC.3